MKKYIYMIIFKNNIYATFNIKKILKTTDYYFVTNIGSPAQAMITYHSKSDRAEKVLGGYLDLIKFIAKENNDKLFIMKGFYRAQGQSIFTIARELNENNKNTYILGREQKFELQEAIYNPIKGINVTDELDFCNKQKEYLEALKTLAIENPEKAKEIAIKHLQKSEILNEDGELQEPYSEGLCKILKPENKIEKTFTN